MDESLIKTIIDISTENPLKRMNFDALCAALNQEISQNNIKVSYHPKYHYLAVYKYTSRCVNDRRWSLYSLLSRGLVLDHQNKNVAAIAFPKFFEVGEMFTDIAPFVTPEYTITEKMDGSMIVLFKHQNEWITATCASFVSDQAKWALQWAQEHLPLDKMDGTNTYLFEVIYPENKIVIDYDFSGMVLLSIYDSFGLEYNYSLFVEESKFLGVNLVKSFSFDSVEEAISTAKKLSRDKEGFVIRFSNGVRLKVKGNEYLRIFHILTNLTPLSVWEAFLNGDDLSQMEKEIPIDFQKDFVQILNIFKNKLDVFADEVETLYVNTRDMSDKQLGEYMLMHPEAFAGGQFPSAKRFIFLRRKGKFPQEVFTIGSFMRRKVFSEFKPKANVLDGYTPSWSVRQVQQDL
jgi:RNA ligase